MRIDHFPEFGCIGFQEILGKGDLAHPRAFQRFPGSPAGWPNGCQGAAALGYRDSAAAFPDIVEECEAFRLELGHAYDPVRHTIIITVRFQSDDHISLSGTNTRT